MLQPIHLLQHASGADLGILFINVLTQSGTEPIQSFFEKITSLFSLMSPISPEREVFVQSALKWSIKSTDYKTGHPDLHQKIAQVFWRGNCLKEIFDDRYSACTLHIMNFLFDQKRIT